MLGSISQNLFQDDTDTKKDDIFNGRKTDNIKLVSKPNKGNAVAAKESSSKGALPKTTVEASNVITQANGVIQQQQKKSQLTNQSQNINDVMDALSKGSVEQIMSMEGRAKIKQTLPGADLNVVIPQLIKRKKAIDQLSKMPAGTKLSEDNKAKLREIGISKPGKYMNFFGGLESSARGGAKFLAETFETVGRTGGAFNPFAAVGKAAEARDAQALVETKLGASSSEFKKLNDKTLFNPVSGEIKLIGGADADDLSTKEKLQIQESITKRLIQQTKNSREIFEMGQNIEAFSQPKGGNTNLVGLTKNPKQISFNNTDSGEKVKVNNAQGIRDVALIYSFIKIIDPGSVVREGEVNLTQAAIDALTRAGINIKRLGTGQLFTPEIRNQMRDIGREKMKATAPRFISAFQSAEAAIKQGKLNRDVIIPKGDADLVSFARKISGADGAKAEVSPANQAAIDFVKNNPNHPKAEAVKAKLASQGVNI